MAAGRGRRNARHSIQIDPNDPKQMYAAISAAGAFRTDDGGGLWVPRNKNVAMDFAPEPFGEVGQCVHKLLLHPARPDRLWQQNHCGVYRSDDRGDDWERLEGNGLPSGFGFPLALHPREPDAAYVIPGRRGESRHAGRAARRLSRRRRRHLGAAPERAAAAGVGRGHARRLRLRPARSGGDLFGTQSGSVFVSPNEGDEWIEVAWPAADPVGRGRGSPGPTSVARRRTGGRSAGVRSRSSTLSDALRALPIADLLLDERGELRRLVNVYLDGEDARLADGLEAPLAGVHEVRVIAAVAGRR